MMITKSIVSIGLEALSVVSNPQAVSLAPCSNFHMSHWNKNERIMGFIDTNFEKTQEKIKKDAKASNFKSKIFVSSVCLSVISYKIYQVSNRQLSQKQVKK